MRILFILTFICLFLVSNINAKIISTPHNIASYQHSILPVLSQDQLNDLKERLPKSFWKKNPIEMQNLLNKIFFPKIYRIESRNLQQLEFMGDLRSQTLILEWDVGVSNWQNFVKILYSDDGNQNLIQDLTHVWDGAAWINQRRITFTYDVSGYEIEQVWQMFNGVSLENFQKFTMTNDASGKVIEMINFEWNGSAWDLSGKSEYTYNGNEQLIEILWLDWDVSVYINEGKDSYTYDTHGNRIEELAQFWENSAWVNIDKKKYSFDVNNNMVEMIWQIWDVSMVWENIEKTTCIYDANQNMIEQLEEYWDFSSWVFNDKGTLSYDANNNCLEEIWQEWDGSVWVNEEKFIHSYLPVGLIDDHYNIIPERFSIFNYPNPFNPITTIEFSIPKTEFVTLKIYNTLGQEVATLVDKQLNIGKYEYVWDASVFASGIYYYKIEAGSFTQTKKLLLIK